MGHVSAIEGTIRAALSTQKDSQGFLPEVQYAVQGYYLQRDGSREWRTWYYYGEKSLEEAKRSEKIFRGDGFHLRDEVNMPSDSRIVKLTTFMEVLA